MIHLHKIGGLIIACAAALLSCDRQSTFTVTGQITGLQNDSLYIYMEHRDFSSTVVLDSVKPVADGSFRFTVPSPEYPDLYVLRLGNQSINLSVDSTETIRITASQKNFASDYKVEGSDNSARMKEVVLRRNKLQFDVDELKREYFSKALSAAEFQAKLSELVDEYKAFMKKLIVSNLKSPTAYFALFQKVENALIFDPYQREDSKMYSAVATAWDAFYKGTPRANYLREFTLNAIKERKNAERNSTLLGNLDALADRSNYFTVELPDVNDQTVSLESLKGKVVLLDFTMYAAEYSPLHGKRIYEAYKRLKNNMEVYQVSFDPDVHFWKNAASNLPWICVRDDNGAESSLIARFNIREFPTTYLLDRQGELVKKLNISDNIEAEVKKFL
ncbi:MAG: AhpC/TSA family protein [Prevotella sp.]|jgi:peroxiredoxin|nr:AhpC/TSA family protein [Prevotella sp.]